MRLASALLLSLAVPISIAGGQNEALASSSTPRIEFKTDRIPLKFADGRSGWAQFDLSGEVGGRVSGRFTVAEGRGQAAATMTEYAILLGSLVETETEYEFIIQRARRVLGTRSADQSASLKLAKAPRANRPPGGPELQDSWTETQMADGDIWIIGGKPCEFIGGDLVCSP